MEDLKHISARVPVELIAEIEKDARAQHYATISEYVRAAIREKLEKSKEVQ